MREFDVIGLIVVDIATHLEPKYVAENYGRVIRVADLLEWIEQRDASCADYLAPALREHLKTDADVEDV